MIGRKRFYGDIQLRQRRGLFIFCRDRTAGRRAALKYAVVSVKDDGAVRFRIYPADRMNVFVAD